MTNLDSILKSRDITLLTKVRLVKAMVFPVVMYGCAAESLQSCPILCDPQTAAHQDAPPLGFSRQEHWSGLPFPSPMRESEVAQLCPTLLDPMDCSLPGSSVHGIFQAGVLEWGAIAFSMRQHSVVEKSSTYKGLIQLDSSLGLP